MAHSTVRFAAGAGVVAASLLIVGPNPAQAVADTHGLGPHYNNDSRKNGWSGQGVLNIGDKGPKPDLDPPLMNLGTGGSDLGDLAVVNSVGPEPQVAMRSAAIVPAQPPVGDNVLVAAVLAAAPRSGGDYSGQPVTSFRSPRVVIGNGRTPGTHVREPEAVLEHDTLVSPAAVPAAPAAIEINIPPLPPPLPPVERIGPAELVVGEYGTATTDTVTDPLAGLAGLILIPAIGAALGYRQARAAQSMRQSLGS